MSGGSGGLKAAIFSISMSLSRWAARKREQMAWWSESWMNFKGIISLYDDCLCSMKDHQNDMGWEKTIGNTLTSP